MSKKKKKSTKVQDKKVERKEAVEAKPVLKDERPSGNKLDRIANPTKNVKYGVVVSSDIGSVGFKGNKYNKANCNEVSPLIVESEEDLKKLIKTGHFTQIKIK